MSSLFDTTTDALAASIRLRQVRHNVTSSNIANAETPNFYAKKVDFENALASAISDSKSGIRSQDSILGSIDNIQPLISENSEAAVNNDGNTVDLEKEMSALSENSILYKTALQLINKKMAALKYALGDR